MSSYNILFLSAGRRVELIEHFKRARKEENIDSSIIAVDMSDLSPAIYFADRHYIIPPITHKDYLPELLNIIVKEKIRLIIPTIDTELLIMSQNKDEFVKNGCDVLVSDEKIINTFNDKYETYKYFRENNICSPKTYLRIEDIKDMVFPMFVKPRNGSSSINSYKINNIDELKFFYSYIKDPIIQDFISGEEFTIDVFCDFNGVPIYITPRKRIATRSGEILKGITVKDKKLIELVEKLVLKIKPIGPITVQCIKSEDDYYFIEINPRFGGGCPMSIQAGADSPRAIYKLLKGEKLKQDYYSFQENLLCLRYDQTLFLHR